MDPREDVDVGVQQASISTPVNSSTFTRGQHVCVLILLARGRYCYAPFALAIRHKQRDLARSASSITIQVDLHGAPIKTIL